MTGNGSTIEVSLKGRIGTFALDTCFSVPARGVTGIFGPSGCGKTTIMRCMAGLEHLPGRIVVAGEVWQDTARRCFVPTYKRQVGYVFQEASLFPHLSVIGNLRYGANRASKKISRAAPSYDEVVEMLGLAKLLDRAPDNLSGGERQRVAIGRALLSAPNVLLMDEPLSALDQATRAEILPFLERLHARLTLPILYISHDFAELQRLVDTLMLVNNGRVLAVGSIGDLQTNTNLPLVRGNEPSVVVEGVIGSVDPQFHLVRFTVRGGELTLAVAAGAPGERRRLRILASDVSLTLAPAADSSIINISPARVVSFVDTHSPATVTVILALGQDGCGERIMSRITRRSAEQLRLQIGSAVFAQIKGASIVAS